MPIGSITGINQVRSQREPAYHLRRQCNLMANGGPRRSGAPRDCESIEEAGGGGRSGSSCSRQLQPEVIQDPVGDGGLGDYRDDAHRVATAVAAEDVDGEDSSQLVGPDCRFACRGFAAVACSAAGFAVVGLEGGRISESTAVDRGTTALRNRCAGAGWPPCYGPARSRVGSQAPRSTLLGCGA